MKNRTNQTALRGLLLLLACSWTASAPADMKKAKGLLQPVADKSRDAANQTDLQQAGGQAGKPFDGGTKGGGEGSTVGPDERPAGKGKGSGRTATPVPSSVDSNGGAGTLRNDGTSIGRKGSLDGKVKDMPTATPEPKSMSSKAADAAAKYLPESSEDAEKKARWSADNSGSLNNSVAGQKKALELNQEKKDMDAEIRAAKGKHDKRAELQAKIKKNEIRISQVEGGLQTLHNAYNNGKKTPEDRAFIVGKEGKAAAKIAEWKAQIDGWKAQIGEIDAR